MTFKQWFFKKYGSTGIEAAKTPGYAMARDAWEAGLKVGESASHRHPELSKRIKKTIEVTCGGFPCICGICDEENYRK